MGKLHRNGLLETATEVGGVSWRPLPIVLRKGLGGIPKAGPDHPGSRDPLIEAS